jgi:hypothetical protein
MMEDGQSQPPAAVSGGLLPLVLYSVLTASGLSDSAEPIHGSQTSLGIGALSVDQTIEVTS